MRIPKSVVEKYLRDRGAQVGPLAQITVTPERKQRKTAGLRPAPTVDELAQQLAAIAKQNDAAAQRLLDKIAERAPLMQFVPENKWQDIVWLVDEEER